MYKKNISIVIPCSSDTRLSKCLLSIGKGYDVVVALNCPTDDVKKIVSNFKVRSVEIYEKSLPAALNAGIEATLNDSFIIIDSDCVFEVGAIDRVAKQLKKIDVVKGHVKYLANSAQSRIVSAYRSYVNYTSPKPYNPFLGINKKIKEKVGGYFFDDSIGWTEDAELYVRLKQSGINFYYEPLAIAKHDSLTIFQDLKSARNYGSGKARRVAKGIATSPGTHFKDFIKVAKAKKILVGLYSIVWNLCYLFGYGYQLYIVNNMERCK